MTERLRPLARENLVRLGALVLVGLFLAAILGCEASGQHRLAQLPEAQLYYPGSETLGDGGRDGGWTIIGTTNPSWRVILGTDASVEEVLAFYETELADRNWERGSQSRTTSEIVAHSWSRDGTRVRIGFKDTEDRHTEVSDRFATLYEVLLIESEPER